MPPTLKHGKICHVELPATDVERPASYERVFDWHACRHPGGAVTFDESTGEVSGHWVPGRATGRSRRAHLHLATGEEGQMVTLTTSRLLLRRWREDDVPAMAAINADPEVMRWIGGGTPIDEDATAAGIARSEKHWETHGFGLFAVEIRATGRLAGFTGLNTPYLLPEVLPAVEIGWRLGRQFWGRGLATEAARAALDFGFTDRGLDRIVSIHQVGNDASGADHAEAEDALR